MKPVDILIPNHNSMPVLELAVDSIHARTAGYGFSIIVHDDSDNGTDRAYLEHAEREGRLRFVRGTTRERWGAERKAWSPHGDPASYYHGCALNVLVNETCRADYAVLMDSDVFVRDKNWLDMLLAFMDGETLIAAHEWRPSVRETGVCVPGWWRGHFAILDMSLYRDGMEVDWRGGTSRVGQRPFRSLFPVEVDDDAPVVFDPGSSLWMKMRFDNPKRFRGAALPDSAEAFYYHFMALSGRRLAPSESLMIRDELALLQANA